MAILTVCQRGNVRSVTLAIILKDFIGLSDVIAIGVETTTPDKRKQLEDWADEILIAGDVDTSMTDIKDNPKTVVLAEIGRDVWGQPMHPELVRLSLAALERIGITIEKSGGYFYPTKETYLAANDAAYARR